MQTKVHFIDQIKAEDHFDFNNTLFVIDDNVIENFPDILPYEAELYIVYDHSFLKDLKDYWRLMSLLQHKFLSKNLTIVAIGGGGVMDFVGFAAATFMRGVNLVLIPTTIIGMVDASIGGKNGLNYDLNKNVIGTIYLPSEVFIDINFCKSIGKKEFKNGFAEIVKIALLLDKSLLMDCRKFIVEVIRKHQSEEIINNHFDFLKKIIARSIELKMQIVKKDLYCTGIRHILNFGHTIGHLVENRYELSHGEAVAYGMLQETLLTANLGYSDPAIHLQVKDYVKHLLGATSKANINLKKIASSVRTDKKVKNENIIMPILTALGESKLIEIPLNDLRNEMLSRDAPAGN